MFDPLDVEKKGKKDDSLLILANIYLYFYENDTNEVKGSYYDDCLEKRKKQQHILHIRLGHSGNLLQKYEFCKMPSERNERGKFFQCLIIFCIFCTFLHWGLFADQVELTKYIPLYSILIFHVVTPLT